MNDSELMAARARFEGILVEPSAADLWELQKLLIVIGDEPSLRARAVVRAFHGCLRSLESKSASRSASRWGAVLGTAAVGSVSLPELLGRQETALRRLLESGVPALLEVGAALQSARAWEVEAQLIYDEFAWFLYDELWDVSAIARPATPAAERRDQIDQVIDLLLDPALPDGERAALVINVFQAILGARLAPLFEGLTQP